MKPTYSDAGKLAWYPDITCPVCGGDVNSWDKRCSRALGYRQIVCEGCISEEYQVTVVAFPPRPEGRRVFPIRNSEKPQRDSQKIF